MLEINSNLIQDYGIADEYYKTLMLDPLMVTRTTTLEKAPITTHKKTYRLIFVSDFFSCSVTISKQFQATNIHTSQIEPVDFTNVNLNVSPITVKDNRKEISWLKRGTPDLNGRVLICVVP